jgi:2-phosphoglycerate kinase
MEREDYAKVILIGGAPLSGKTTVARKLAAKLGYACLSTDDLGQAVRALTTPESHPNLHPMAGYDYREYYVCHSLEELMRHSQKQHQALRPAIEALVRAHAAWGQPIVIEGWSLDPEWVSRLELPNVKSVWFIADKALLAHRIHQDESFFQGASNEEEMIEHYLERSLWHNAYLRQAVDRLGMPSIELRLDASPAEVCERSLSLLRG